MRQKQAKKPAKTRKETTTQPRNPRRRRKKPLVPPEAERARDVERMLAPASDDEAATDSEGEWTTDKAGNTISKAEARRKEEEEGPWEKQEQQAITPATSNPSSSNARRQARGRRRERGREKGQKQEDGQQQQKKRGEKQE